MGVEYVQLVKQVRTLTSSYWFDLLIALLAIVAMLEVVLGRGTPGAPTTTLWFCVPAIAVLVLPVFARRRFPFAGPATFWLLAAGISFVDPLLMAYANAIFAIGIAVAFLLGNLRDARRAGLGLAPPDPRTRSADARTPGAPELRSPERRTRASLSELRGCPVRVPPQARQRSVGTSPNQGLPTGSDRFLSTRRVSRASTSRSTKAR